MKPIFHFIACVTTMMLGLSLSACAPNGQGSCNESNTLTGTDDADELNGGPGDECLYGWDGNDLLVAGDGNDVLDGGQGSDAMQGGLGDDTYVVNLDDHMDIVTDHGGEDTIRFGRGVTLENLAAKLAGGNLTIQIEQADAWTYVIAAGVEVTDESIIEFFVLPGGERVVTDEFLSRVSQDVMSTEKFARKVAQQRTTQVAESDRDGELVAAIKDAVDSTLNQSLCTRPALLPMPDEVGKYTGQFRPEEYFAVFQEHADDERSVRQRQQFDALARVGIMGHEAVVSQRGQPGEKYTLTIDGWGYMDDRGCIYYGTQAVEEIVSYRPMERGKNAMGLYAVEAIVGAREVEIWARDATVQSSFPKLAASLRPSTIKTFVLRTDSGWVGATRSGRPLGAGAARASTLPNDREMLALKAPTGPGTVGSGSICIAPPLLARGDYRDPRSPYITYAQDPFGGGNVAQFEKTKAYLDMLTRIGAATSGVRFETTHKGDAEKYLEYRFSPELTIKDNAAGHRCMEVATTRFDVLHARWDGARLIKLRGTQKATPAHDWVRHPDFLAAHPEIARSLDGAQPVIATIQTTDGRPVRALRYRIP